MPTIDNPGITFLDRDREILRRVPAKKPRGNQARLTPEQVVEIRRRVDSLTTPWSLRQLAHDFGVSVRIIVAVARRRFWDDPAYEPDNREWWWRELHRRRE